MAEIKSVGLYLPDRLNEYFRIVQTDAEQTARRHGLNILTHFADGRAATQAKQIHQAIQAPESARPAAIIAAAVRDNSLNRLPTRRPALESAGFSFIAESTLMGWTPSEASSHRCLFAL
jgi:DNA-binding LacI/PurR family transcriptional regulator